MGIIMALVTQALPLASLMLLLLWRSLAVGAQRSPTFQLQQPQDKVSAKAGETITLTCTTAGTGPAGLMKWLKGWGDKNETIYDQNSPPPPHLTRAEPESNTDFSIHIRDVHPKDAGTYYCVKFRKTRTMDEVFRRGNGTEVSILAEPTRPVVSGPRHRAGPGQSVSVTCMAGGFFPKDIGVKWLKDKAPISAQQPQVTPGQTTSSYNVSSTVTVTLQKDDVRSQLVCEVQHRTLEAPLRETYQLSKALRVSPGIQVVTDPRSPVELNKTVNFSCHVRGFYPREVAVTWLENGTEMKVENTPQVTETRQGLFELQSLVKVQAMEEKNGSVFTCRVVHDGQEPVSRMATLQITAPAQGELNGLSQGENGVNLLSSPGLWLGLLLEKVLLGALLIFLFKRARA
ncbi:tyrosine-protein phosphatase non-receptor type substrate 1-like [Apus apus]|uniref:tyrosine-protein phosphatase non-receptor type substrate 1-like n=1 Tax=Apus apus TaxID=8895 RepID=UPI0021F8EFE5|nr:tyrosine-protein phosphatase non-receptor type substrate 1-like [Apus apus]